MAEGCNVGRWGGWFLVGAEAQGEGRGSGVVVVVMSVVLGGASG